MGQDGGRDGPGPPHPTFPTDLGDGLENGSGSPFRKWTLSNAAQTHRLRRLRGPAKCRECEAFMVSGTECEEVWPGPMTQCSLLTPLTSPSPRHLHDLIFLSPSCPWTRPDRMIAMSFPFPKDPPNLHFC